jgi:5-methyltetrahydrofolate--homocysteine methyltransferase
MDRINRLLNSAHERILILDGASGTLILSMGLTEDNYRDDRFQNHDVKLTGNFDILSLTKPELISSIHKSYLEAGADFLKTNTFNGSLLEQNHYKTSEYVYEINLSAAKLARDEADKFTAINPAKPRFVAGVIGPTRYVCSIDVADKTGFEVRSLDELKESYTPQIKGLIDGGVDLLLLETIYDAENTRAALSVLDDLNKSNFPIWLSATMLNNKSDSDFKILIKSIIEISIDYHVISLGLNCSIEIPEAYKYLESLVNSTNSLVSYNPSAGLPDNSGKYPISSHQFAEGLKELAAKGLLNIAGGCCGTNPEYIRLISNSLKDIPPRKHNSQK